MKKLICLILLLFSMGSMYYFSSQKGEDSSKQSNKVIEVIDDIRHKVTITNKELVKVKEKIFNKLKVYGKNYVVRKAAHFSIYACIGASAMLFFYTMSKKIVLSGLLASFLSIIYAIYDETRQLDITGRSGSIKDVIIDSLGALTSIILSVILLSISNGVRKKIRKNVK